MPRTPDLALVLTSTPEAVLDVALKGKGRILYLTLRYLYTIKTDLVVSAFRSSIRMTLEKTANVGH
jgi:hypothetical protein